MNIAYWKIFLIISSLSTIILLGYLLKENKKYTKIAVGALFILFLFFSFLMYQSKIWYNKKYNRPISKKAYRIVVPLGSEPRIEEYLKNIDKNRPIIVAIPLVLQIRFTDPMNPKSPHALMYILLKNNGNLKAVGTNVKWEIIDNGNRITPPDEWNKVIGRKEESFVLEPGRYLTYLYGPEIGTYASTSPPKIELTLRVKYKRDDEKEYSYFCKSKSNPNPKPKDTYVFDILDVK
jgi:hypothetical protein